MPAKKETKTKYLHCIPLQQITHLQYFYRALITTGNENHACSLNTWTIFKKSSIKKKKSHKEKDINHDLKKGLTSRFERKYNCVNASKYSH